MIELGLLSLYMTFVYDGRKFVILMFEGNMVEVKEKNGRHWAWPKQAKVKI